ncbi:MAG: hypothetical protein FD180_67 [Planctomycetota bacterium]|nr:MAG: hypothetical protein FD180_67 [Planctomycetota bacterium]
MTDGRVYEGRVLAENDKEVKIRTAKTTLTVPRNLVARIDLGASLLDDRDKKLEALETSRPGEYLDAAEWMLGSGSAVWDPEMFRRLCAIPVALDANAAFRANLILGRGWDSHGRPDDAAEAWLRAAAADPVNSDARKLAKGAKATREAAARRSIEALRDGLNRAGNGDIEGAIPLIRSAKGGPGAEVAEKALGRTLESLMQNLQRRIACKSCDGGGQIACPLCKGTGTLDCSECGGDGLRTGFRVGIDEQGFEALVCRACYGVGDVLCPNCKAERDLMFVTGTKENEEKKREKTGPVVHTTAGHEVQEIRKQINLRNYTSGSSKVLEVIASPVDPGGKRTCPGCLGIPFDPPAETLDGKSLASAAKELDTRLANNAPLLPDAPPVELYESELIADRAWLYTNGRWVNGK